MDVGLQLILTSGGWDQTPSDGQVYAEELALGRQAEELGFDAIWPTEHHFFDYSFCPDNLQLLSYFAACTESIALGTAAIILPWNDPLRVAEKVSMLDHLSNGRVRVGFGRGLSRREYAPFRSVEMDEARERFDEASMMIVAALETGIIEGGGPMYPQTPIEIRPRPERSFTDRIYAVANSADSVEACARMGGRMIMFAETNWQKRMGSIETHRQRFRELHGREAPPVMTADFTYCHSDPDMARERAERYLAGYLSTLLEHYELMGDHFADIKGYSGYAGQADKLRQVGVERYIEGFLAANAYGTPQQIIDRLEERREILGSFEECTCFRFGGIPFDEADASMRLFASEVLPVIKGWD